MAENKYTREQVEKEVFSFYEALEIDTSNFDDDVELKDKKGNTVGKTTGRKEAMKILAMAMMKGRLILDSENVCAEYKLRKPVESGEIRIVSIKLSTDNCSSVKTEAAKEAIEAGDKWAGIKLFCNGNVNVTDQNLNLIPNGEVQILEYLTQLFFAY